MIAILGCADGGSSCTPLATLQTRYATAAECNGATAPALEAHSDFDYPTLLAQCRRGSPASTAEAAPQPPDPAMARRG